MCLAQGLNLVPVRAIILTAGLYLNEPDLNGGSALVDCQGRQGTMRHDKQPAAQAITQHVSQLIAGAWQMQPRVV